MTEEIKLPPTFAPCFYQPETDTHYKNAELRAIYVAEAAQYLTQHDNDPDVDDVIRFNLHHGAIVVCEVHK